MCCVSCTLALLKDKQPRRAKKGRQKNYCFHKTSHGRLPAAGARQCLKICVNFLDFTFAVCCWKSEISSTVDRPAQQQTENKNNNRKTDKFSCRWCTGNLETLLTVYTCNLWALILFTVNLLVVFYSSSSEARVTARRGKESSSFCTTTEPDQRCRSTLMNLPSAQTSASPTCKPEYEW